MNHFDLKKLMAVILWASPVVRPEKSIYEIVDKICAHYGQEELEYKKTKMALEFEDRTILDWFREALEKPV